MYSFEISDYTFFSIYQKMYNIAAIFLHSVWLSNAFFAGWTIKRAPRRQKLYIFSKITKKCIIGHDQNIHFSQNLRKMYILTDLTSLL